MSKTPRWFKSSYSSSAGGECIEVAYDWHKSSYSDDGGGQCVEVSACSRTVHVRDSKLGDGSPILTVSSASWDAFLPAAEAR
ncbi:DUF397 domain-containing protein [Streptomyces sp. NBC_00237]|uniref:DUF397 domain-containing protein n=1 Tax=Streptomyces sp. NBC_00237 TaxID=2975687 RepID=UPI00224CC388|nr:DUF397 domain-containing protein [Streptomyces sp. NBC_00237]MCX5207273.1 DUF397 domain-containing protein [Streptomyces sp. NBC_00237]